MADFTFDPNLPAMPLDNPAEVESLLALINEHITTEAEFVALLQQHDDDSPEFAAKGGDALSTKGENGYWEIAGHPATALNTILLKGRYLAARKAAGDLSFEHALAFVESFLDEAADQGQFDDPLIAAITAYRAGLKTLNELEIGENIGLAEEAALFDAAYGKQKDLLIEAAPTATSIAGVREAIRLAFDEDAICDQVAEGALRAALAFLDGRAPA